MTFDNFLRHLKMLSFVCRSLGISGFTCVSEFDRRVGFASPNCNLYHLLIPFFLLLYNILPIFPLPWVPAPSLFSLPSPYTMKDCRVRMCAPFSECISHHKPHSYVQIHFYYAYFSWLIFSQNKLRRKILNVFNLRCFGLMPSRIIIWLKAL